MAPIHRFFYVQLHEFEAVFFPYVVSNTFYDNVMMNVLYVIFLRHNDQIKLWIIWTRSSKVKQVVTREGLEERYGNKFSEEIVRLIAVNVIPAESSSYTETIWEVFLSTEACRWTGSGHSLRQQLPLSARNICLPACLLLLASCLTHLPHSIDVC